MILSVGYPRSGNSWIRYICLTLLELEVGDPHVYDRDDSPYRKLHEFDGWGEIGKRLVNTRLIIPVRNYKEAVIRHRLGDTKVCTEDLLKGVLYQNRTNKKQKMSYLHPLYVYEKWPEGRRHMVYYEDLITSFDGVLYDLACFLGVSDYLVRVFLNDLDHHKTLSLEQYKYNQTNGDVVDFHKFKLDENARFEWDRLIQKENKELYDKYLTQYAERR